MQTLLKYSERDLVFVDIETVRCAKELGPVGTPLYNAWSYKMRYEDEQARKAGDSSFSLEESFKSKAALYAPFAKIAVISVGMVQDSDKLRVKSFVGDEAKLLTDFNSMLNVLHVQRPSALFAGFNIVGFDLPFINKRMLSNDIEPHACLDTGEQKPWEQRVLDLSKFWQGSSFYPDSLSAILYALGLPTSKSTMSGAGVSDAFYEGKIDEITNYCEGDVFATANVYRKLLHKKPYVLEARI